MSSSSRRWLGMIARREQIEDFRLEIGDLGLWIADLSFFDEQEIEGPRMFEMPRGNAAERTTTPE